MTADPIDAEILRRNFVAIATSTYEDPSLPDLPVLDEVRTLADWFCGAELGDRRFTHRYPDLADNPTEDQIRHALKDPDASRKWRRSDAVVLFITGHGFVADGTLWLALRQTRTDALRATALKAAEHRRLADRDRYRAPAAGAGYLLCGQGGWQHRHVRRGAARDLAGTREHR